MLRDPQKVLQDLNARLITEEAAVRVYGVVFSDGKVDEKATAAARLAVRRERLGGREPAEPVEPPAGARRIGDLLYVVNGRWWCNGADLGSQSENYKDKAVTRDVPVRKIAAEFEVPNHEIADRWVSREFICPVTGYLIASELVMVGEASLHDIVPVA